MVITRPSAFRFGSKYAGFFVTRLFLGDLLNIHKFLSCLFDVGVHGQDQGNEFVNDWCGVGWLVPGVSLMNLKLSLKETTNWAKDDALVKEALELCHSSSK